MMKDSKHFKENYEIACVKTLEGHTSGVTSLVLINEGSVLCSCSYCEIKLWKASQEGGELSCIQTLEGHTYAVSSIVWVKEQNVLCNGSI